jgi:hypothetical protein
MAYLTKKILATPLLKTSKNDFDKLKFARDAYTVGRHPSIKDGLGFKREAKNLTSHKAPISIKEKGKAPMAYSIQKNHAFMYHDRRHSRNVYRSYDAFDSHAMIASSSSIMHDRNLARKNAMPRRNVVHVRRKANYESSTIFILAMLPLLFVERIRRWLLEN